MKKILLTTLVGGILFLIPLVFFIWVLGQAFQIMMVIATLVIFSWKTPDWGVCKRPKEID